MNEEIPSRRRVLRGAMAAGCGLWLPIALSGCDAKAPATPALAEPSPTPPAPASVPGSPPASTINKAPQASVQYQAQPKGEQKCSGCVHFVAASSTCKLVEGSIGADAWCVLWAKVT